MQVSILKSSDNIRRFPRLEPHRFPRLDLLEEIPIRTLRQGAKFRVHLFTTGRDIYGHLLNIGTGSVTVRVDGKVEHWSKETPVVKPQRFPRLKEGEKVRFPRE